MLAVALTLVLILWMVSRVFGLDRIYQLVVVEEDGGSMQGL